MIGLGLVQLVLQLPEVNLQHGELPVLFLALRLGPHPRRLLFGQLYLKALLHLLVLQVVRSVVRAES